MSPLKAIFYGIIQGLAEFLPISSSGHLAIFQNIFSLDSIDDMLLFNLILHLGTLLAVFIAYFNDIKLLVIAFFTLLKKLFTGKFKYKNFNKNERFVILIVLATIPLVLAVFIDDKVESVSSYTKVIGVLLIINALILFISDRIAKGVKRISDLMPHNALFIGLFQLFAIFPGISRSGMTITGGLVNGLKRENAVKFSFIMSIPAILGANVFKISSAFETVSTLESSAWIAVAIGFVTAFLAGFCAIILLRYITKKDNFFIFSIYCALVGLVAVIFG